MPNWEGSTRKERLPKDWPVIRKRILARDGYRCMWLDDGRPCGAPANQVDHIRRGDNHDDSNLRALCGPHHLRKSGSEGGRAFRRVTRYNVKRPAEPHPGLKQKKPPGQ